LADRIKGTAPTLEEVAAALAMSDRTLQRELRNEQTSFRELVDVVRREIAVQQLAQPGNSAAEVGFLLGFSDPSAFTRAFRRWTGTAPAAFRSA
jgi:AraC-like DNA-binding protein